MDIEKVVAILKSDPFNYADVISTVSSMTPDEKLPPVIQNLSKLTCRNGENEGFPLLFAVGFTSALVISAVDDTLSILVDRDITDITMQVPGVYAMFILSLRKGLFVDAGVKTLCIENLGMSFPVEKEQAESVAEG